MEEMQYSIYLLSGQLSKKRISSMMLYETLRQNSQQKWKSVNGLCLISSPGFMANLIGLSFQSSMSEADLRALEKERHYMLVNPTWNPTY